MNTSLPTQYFYHLPSKCNRNLDRFRDPHHQFIQPQELMKGRIPHMSFPQIPLSYPRIPPNISKRPKAHSFREPRTQIIKQEHMKRYKPKWVFIIPTATQNPHHETFN